MEFRGGFGGIEVDEKGREFRWTTGSGELGVAGGGEAVLTVEISARPGGVGETFALRTEDLVLIDGLAGAEVAEAVVALPAAAWERARPVVQNAGSELLADGSSRDRGTLVTGGSPYADWDGERYEQP